MEHFAGCDEIWHAGDIGTIEVADQITSQKKLIAVHGNIDDQQLRAVYPKVQRFYCEEVEVMITHIGGYPGNYAPPVKPILFAKPPQLFVCGHSHILKIIHDPKLNMLVINPGAAGVLGIHKVITIVKISIEGKRIFNCTVIELGKREQQLSVSSEQ